MRAVSDPDRSGTFDVALVSDGLQGRTAGQELLQLVSGLLVVGAVHAGGGLHGCGGGETKHDSVVHHASKHTDRHDGRFEASRELNDWQIFYRASGTREAVNRNLYAFIFSVV